METAKKRLKEMHPNDDKSSRKVYKLKSLAKAAGVKSVFAIGNDLLMTGFGPGNDATIEKRVFQNRAIETLSSPEQYSAEFQNKQFKIKGNIKVLNHSTQKMEEIQTELQDNYNRPNFDLLGCKNVLEQKYFGRTFSDNIHVQIAYNIMDIEKLLTPYINNIIYTLNELMRGNSKDDFFGCDSHFSVAYLYDELKAGYSDRLKTKPNLSKNIDRIWNNFYNYMDSDSGNTEARLAYFGELFYKPKETESTRSDNKTHLTSNQKKKWELKSDKEVYNIFAILCDLRHFCTHGESKTPSGKPFPYNLEDNLFPEAKQVLNSLFEEKAGSLGAKAFGKTAGKTDVSILLKVFEKEQASQKEQQALLKEYYDFKVQKTYKNMGFSIKKLREAIMENPDAAKFKDDQYSSLRHKLYGLFDFILVKYFLDTSDSENLQNNDIFRQLRACRCEEEKEQVYRSIAVNVWEKVKKKALYMFNQVVSIPSLSKDKMKQMDMTKSTELLSSIETISTQASLFSEMIFMMTYLLDGKEINLLCTSLIEKFENIASFNEVLKNPQIGYETNYTEGYDFFKDADKTAKELRQVNNMARMTKPLGEVSTTCVMYNEAAKILGAKPMSKSELESVFNLDNHDFTYSPSGKKTPNKNFRNFIINNVITSRRFLYLIRYGNPEKIRKIAINPSIISFVLKQIPDEQIKRYYPPCIGKRTDDVTLMRNELGKMLQSVNFEQFSTVNNKQNAAQNPNGEKARLQACVRLYLTVPYLFIKNMVNINARYVLAFHCLERDHALYFHPDKSIDFNKQNYKEMANEFQVLRKAKKEQYEKEYKHKKEEAGTAHTKKIDKLNHQIAYIDKDIENMHSFTCNTYRNQIAHLNVVSNLQTYVSELPNDYQIISYFSFYHYCIQLGLKKNVNPGNHIPLVESLKNEANNAQSYSAKKTLEYFDLIEKNKTYCKDFLKALNAPFSYNLPRFKNLSIEALFDKNIVYEKADLTKE